MSDNTYPNMPPAVEAVAGSGVDPREKRSVKSVVEKLYGKKSKQRLAHVESPIRNVHGYTCNGCLIGETFRRVKFTMKSGTYYGIPLCKSCYKELKNNDYYSYEDVEE